MQLPPDYGATLRKPAGASDSWDEDNIKELETAIAPPPVQPPTLPPIEPPPAPIMDERARLLALIEQSKMNSDRELVDAKAEQAKKDNMAAILGGVNLFGSGMASQNAGSTIAVDGSFNDKLVADGKAGVEDAKTSRDSRLKDLMGNYDRYREGAKDKRDLAADKRLIENDKYDRIYKQKQLDVSSTNAAAIRELAQENKAANRDLRERALKIREGDDQEKNDLLRIPGYDRVEGRISAEEAKKTREGLAAVGELRSLIDQYKASINDSGNFEAFGAKKEQKRKLASQIQRATGKANDFGVIQPGELELLEKMSTSDPATLDTFFTNNSTSLAGVDQLKANLGIKIAEKMNSIGYAPKTGVASNTDKVKVVDSNGRVGTIPRANLEKALTKGYKVVE